MSDLNPRQGASSSRRKPAQSQKTAPAPDNGKPTRTSPTRTKKQLQPPNDLDIEMGDAESGKKTDLDRDEEMADHVDDEEDDDEEDEERYGEEDYDRDEDDDEEDDDGVFDGSYLAGGANLSNTLRALSGLVSGISSRLRDILENLRKKDDPTAQLIALQSLAELLLVSTEDNLSGHFSPDSFVKELVSLMQDQGPYGENPEMMLLACRCIANLMEALPAATANVVYGGAVPVLCAKLMEIQYIDLAEQALSTLEKISVEYPTSIVREGGLTACLTYLDFFATNVQRTAVTTAANCCRNIPEDCFGTVRDVMGTLRDVLKSSDQKVVEQGCQCVARIAESFRHHADKLEQLMSQDLLKAILQLLLPGTTNIVGTHIHTQFLRVLSITAKASPVLSVELLKMDIVDTLYQILTGISLPEGDSPALKTDSVMTMQALIHKPREQIFETLNVICELLPSFTDCDPDEITRHRSRRRSSDLRTEEKETPDELRRRLLKENKLTLKRFAGILLPTLTDAYTSTVNLNVRQKVLTAQLKMISNMDTEILKESLSGIEFASHLATILSQQDHTTLVMFAIHAAELLLHRLPEVYRYHFYREGVFAEIQKIAAKSESSSANQAEGEDDKSDDSENEDRLGSSPVSSRSSSSSRDFALVDLVHDLDLSIVHMAKKFIEYHERDGVTSMKHKAQEIMDSLTKLAQGLKIEQHPAKLFEQLAGFFDSNDSLKSISSFELLSSGIVEAFLSVLESSSVASNEETRRSFLEVFMSNRDGETPFSILVKKLQDLLSRSEHFEVVTVHQNHDGNRSSASMLAKQLRLKLVAEEGSDIPRSYRNIMVSIHAIATFKALDDYLKPRIYISERPRNRRDKGLSGALAAFAAAAGLPHRASSGAHISGSGEGTSSSGPASKPKGRRSSGRTPSGAGAGSSTSAPKIPSREEGATSLDQEPLECMDERPIADDEEMGDMDAVLDDLERDMEDEPEPDTSAVNMEVAGGKVTARKEDGTRVATPVSAVQSGLSSAVPRSGNRTNSSASAGASSINDWHIEFSINGHTISNDMTIYKAVQLNRNDASSEPSYRNIWSAVHPITFRRVPGAAPPDGPLSPGSSDSSQSSDATMPASLDRNKITSSILRLLSILHALNANIDDVFQDMEIGKPLPQPLSQFVNTKLTAKLNRQLEEPLIVASACLPTWSEDLARFYPFLFPFETRHLYLQSTSFGYSRSMTRWQNSQQADSRQDRHRDENRPFLGRLQRQKVRISRERILESAIKVMEIYGASPSILEVEYFEEVGTGLGPTLEFYSSVSRAFVSKKLKLWRENDSHDNSEYVFGHEGLFPAPIGEKTANSENGKKLLHLFKIMGKFVARSMLDSRIIDIYFNPTFFRTGESCEKAVPPSLGAVKSVDRDLAKSLKLLRKFAVAKKDIDDNRILTFRGKQERYKEITFDGVKVEDLELDFTLPGYPDIELIPNGANMPVTLHNVGEYVDRVIETTLVNGVRRQVEAFRIGFSQVFPYNALRSFTPDELVMLFGQVEEDWSLETLMDSMKADHGFNMDSKTIRNLLQVMSEYSPTERRDFLQFVTGSPKLPIGGFKSLTPLLTVVCKASDPPYTSDEYLPSVMTCVNYLKLPDYSTLEILRERLQLAIREGQGAFHLS